MNNSTYVALAFTNELSEKLKYSILKFYITVGHKAQNIPNPLLTSLKSEVREKKKSNLFNEVFLMFFILLPEYIICMGLIAII